MCVSQLVVGLLKLFEFIDDDRNVSLVDGDEVRVVQQAVDCQELCLLFSLDDADVLTESHQVSFVLTLGLLNVLVAEDEVDLIGDAHTLVLLFVVLEVGDRIGRLAVDRATDLGLFLVHGLLGGDELLELMH